MNAFDNETKHWALTFSCEMNKDWKKRNKNYSMKKKMIKSKLQSFQYKKFGKLKTGKAYQQ
jgi:hypothetical protein